MYLNIYILSLFLMQRFYPILVIFISAFHFYVYFQFSFPYYALTHPAFLVPGNCNFFSLLFYITYQFLYETMNFSLYTSITIIKTKKKVRITSVLCFILESYFHKNNSSKPEKTSSKLIRFSFRL